MTFKFSALAAAVALLAFPLVGVAASTDPSAMPAGHYELDKSHASLRGKVSHFGLSMFAFRFDRFEAAYDFNPAAPDASVLTVSVEVNSLDTGDDKIDKAFAADFMGARTTPVATFVSRSISHTGNKGEIVGDLTLNGVTKPATLDVTFNGFGMESIFGRRAGYSASTVIKRSAFGLNRYAAQVGDDVTIEIDAEFARK